MKVYCYQCARNGKAFSVMNTYGGLAFMNEHIEIQHPETPLCKCIWDYNRCTHPSWLDDWCSFCYHYHREGT